MLSPFPELERIVDKRIGKNGVSLFCFEGSLSSRFRSCERIQHTARSLPESSFLSLIGSLEKSEYICAVKEGENGERYTR